MTGFINSLAILIFLSQMPYLADFDVPVYAMVAIRPGIIFGLPRLTKVVPAPPVAIVVLPIATITMGISTRTVGDEGELPDTFPVPLIPDVPFTWDTLVLIAPYSPALALVGLLESLMTAKVVDDRTETTSDHGREARGQGIGNILVGVFGGMPSCAMIGQTMINVSSGARTRVSTFLAGAFLMLLCVLLGDIVGVLVSMASFTRKAAMQGDVTSVLDPEGGTRVYTVNGEVFFASTSDLVERFDYTEQGLSKVVVDMAGAHVWDSSVVAALDQVTEQFRRHGVEVEISGLDRPSERIHKELSSTLADGN